MTLPSIRFSTIPRVTSILFAALLLFLFAPDTARCIEWEKLDDGLQFARFPVHNAPVSADSQIAVLRIDPELWKLGVYEVDDLAEDRGYSTREWARKHGLVAAINGGMYDRDHRHLGRLIAPGQIGNPRLHPRWKSVVVFDPVKSGHELFRILDLDALPEGISMDDWHSSIQNLRLIKHSGENRWEPGGKSWAEAALAEDRQGRALFIYCPTALTMHEFNNIILQLPLEIVAAQHLDGGFHAQMHIRAGNRTVEFHTGHETPFDSDQDAPEGIRIPQVLGITRR